MDESKILQGQELAIKALEGFSDIEKVAILKGATGTMESILAAKSLGILYANMFKGKP